MPLLPFRGLASQGILQDPSPYDLPATAWSGGVNVRFSEAKAMRAPVFRGVDDALASPPIHVTSLPSSTGFDKVLYVGETGTITSWISGVTTDLTPLGFTPGLVPGQITSAFLGDVIYVNNPGQGVYYMGPEDTEFALDPEWDPAWSARVFRVFKDYPVAFDVTKGAVSYQTMMKWGSNTLAGLTTTSWDATDPTNNAGELIFAGFTGPIMDALPLRDSLIVYTRKEVEEVYPVASVDVFKTRRVTGSGGAIGRNCVVEVDNKHYVFGPDDIYLFDGAERMSLVDGKNKAWVYRHLNQAMSSRCFVAHIPAISSILFCYVSSDPEAFFKAPTKGCNRALCLNYLNGTASPIDLPNVTSIGVANLNAILTWATAGARTWDDVGGSWADQEDSGGRGAVAVSVTMPGVTSDRLLAYDSMDKGRVSFSYIDELNPPAFLERTGLDLDETGAPLGVNKLITRMWPQVTIFRDVPLTIQVGASMTSSGTITWTAPQLYNPATQYKVDVMRGGRYLAVRFSVAAPADFEVPGFDVEVTDNGDR